MLRDALLYHTPPPPPSKWNMFSDSFKLAAWDPHRSPHAMVTCMLSLPCPPKQMQHSFCIPPSFSPTAPAPSSLVLSSDRLSLDSTGWSGTGNLPASASQTLTHFLKAWGKQYKMKLPIGRILRSYRFLNPVISVVNQGLCVLKQSLGYSFCQAWFEKHHTRTHSSRSAGLESWGVEAWGGGGGEAGGGVEASAELPGWWGNEG